MLNTYSTKEDSGLSNEQLEWQKARSRRKITKMDFEIRSYKYLKKVDNGCVRFSK